MFAVYVIALLCWVSVSQSAPLACDDLIRPLNQVDYHHLEGRWALIAGGLSNPAHLETFKLRDSARIAFANFSNTSKISFTRIFSFGDICKYMQSNITMEGSGFNFEEFNITVTVLNTSCPDCAVMSFNNESKEVLRLYLFSRRREVEQKEMEQFKAQAKCLNLSPVVVMDPTKELCPEQITSDPAAQTEEKTA